MIPLPTVVRLIVGLPASLLGRDIFADRQIELSAERPGLPGGFGFFGESASIQ